MTSRNDLNSLLRPEDSVSALFDHQPYEIANLSSLDPQVVVNNATALAKVAKAFRVPTTLTSAVAEVKELTRQHAAGSGIAYLQGQQLLNTPVPNTKR